MPIGMPASAPGGPVVVEAAAARTACASNQANAPTAGSTASVRAMQLSR